MRKFITGFIFGAIVFGSITAFAATQFVAYVATFKVIVNGEEFEATTGEILVVENRTYLPLRDMGTALGVRVHWNEELRQVEIGDTNQPQEYSEATFVDDLKELYLNPVFSSSEADAYELVSYEKIYEDAYFRLRRGEFSNLYGSFLLLDAVLDSLPEHQEELQSKLPTMEIVTYNDRLYVNDGEIRQFCLQREIVFHRTGPGTPMGYQIIITKEYQVYT